MSQPELVSLGEVLVKRRARRYPKGSREREAYEGALGLLGMMPSQPWWKRAWSKLRKRRAERALRRMGSSR